MPSSRTVVALVLLLAALFPGVAAPPGGAVGIVEERATKPVLRSLHPASGDVAGGTAVTIRGRHLGTSLRVRFGGVRVPYERLGRHRIRILTPARVSGDVAVRVRSDGRWSNRLTFHYAGPTPPTLSRLELHAVTPAAGPVTGGSVVRLDGAGFSGDSHVHFGETPATNVVVLSSSTILATSPAHMVGPVSVRVDSAGASTADGPQARFEFQPVADARPRITELAPYRGPQSGGNRVVVTGEGFYNGVTSVTFGGTPGTGLVVLSDTVLEVTAPARGRSMLMVRVHNGPVSSYANWSAYYTFDDGPRIETVPMPRDADPTFASVNLRDLDCPAPGMCVAVGDYEGLGVLRGLAEVLDGGLWRPVALPRPSSPTTPTPTVGVHAVDCPSPAFCIAAGSYSGHPLIYTWDGDRWSAVPLEDQSGPGGALTDLECVSTTSCVALGQRCQATCVPIAFTMGGGTWTPRPLLLPPGLDRVRINDLDCWSDAGCVAVGKYGGPEELFDDDDTAPLVFRYDGISWSGVLGALPDDTSSSVPGTELEAVSCTAEGCRAMGRHLTADDEAVAYLSTITAAGETVATVLPPPDSDLWIYVHDFDIDCVSFDHCRAVANYRRTDRGYSAMDISILGGTPNVAPVRDLSLNSLSCPSAAGCAAVGGLALVQLGTTPTVQRAPEPMTPRDYYDGPAGENAFQDCTGNDLELVVADSATSAVAIGSCFRATNSWAMLMTGIEVPAA